MTTKILIFGASGMVGKGILRECLLDKDVSEVKVIGRRAIDAKNPKLKQFTTADLLTIPAAETEGYNACFFSLGSSSVGQSEDEYRKINHDLPLTIAKKLVAQNPSMVFVYVSGKGTDSSEKGAMMWARVKGKTENELLKLPFKGAYMIRLGALVGRNGEAPRAWYRHLYTATLPLQGVLEKLFPNQVTNTEVLGRAVLNLVKTGAEKRVVNSPEFRNLA